MESRSNEVLVLISFTSTFWKRFDASVVWSCGASAKPIHFRLPRVSNSPVSFHGPESTFCVHSATFHFTVEFEMKALICVLVLDHFLTSLWHCKYDPNHARNLECVPHQFDWRSLFVRIRDACKFSGETRVLRMLANNVAPATAELYAGWSEESRLLWNHTCGASWGHHIWIWAIRISDNLKSYGNQTPISHVSIPNLVNSKGFYLVLLLRIRRYL